MIAAPVDREGLSSDRHAEGIANGEVTGGELARMVILREEHRFVGTINRPPIGDPSLESSPCRVLELAGVSSPQIVEKRLGLEPRLGLKHLLDFVPHLGEGVDAGSVLAG
ncbi:MAG: hypothetical protein AAGD07_10455 [Planctomycetota bacterium]